MYELVHRESLTVHHYSFGSIAEFVDHLQRAQVAPAFQDRQASMQDYDEFTATESLEEALRICRYGYHEGFEEFSALDAAIMRELDMSFDVVRTFNDYVGFAPDVKAYLEGSPLTMINKPQPVRKRIRVLMNTSYDNQARREQILNFGASVLTAIKILEMQGYAVELTLFEMSFCDMGDGTMEVHLSEFDMKQTDERVNIQKLYFPLCHPSWIRRLNFRLIETTPNISYHWPGTYGLPCNRFLMKKVLEPQEGEILVPILKDLNIEGEDVVEDARRVFACFNACLPEKDQLRLREQVHIDDER